MRLEDFDSYGIRKKYVNNYLKFIQKIKSLSNVSLLMKFCLSVPVKNFVFLFSFLILLPNKIPLGKLSSFSRQFVIRNWSGIRTFTL